MAEVESARDLEDGDLRSYRIKAFAWILGGLIILIACLLIVDHGERRSDALVAQAYEVPGIVTGGFRNRQIKWVTVEFTYDGETRTGRVWLDSVSPHYRSGEQVTVLVDPTDPARISLRGENDIPPWLVWPFVITLILSFTMIGSALGMLWRHRRIRRILARAAFFTTGCRFTVVGLNRYVDTVPVVHLDGIDHSLRLGGMLRWRWLRSATGAGRGSRNVIVVDGVDPIEERPSTNG